MQPARAGITDDQLLIRNAGEIWTRFDQVAQKLHLPSCGTLKGIDPVPVRVIDDWVPSSDKAPDGMMAIGHAASSRKHRAVNLLSHVVVAEISRCWIPDWPWIVGMIFVVRLQIQSWLGRLEAVVARDPLPYRNIVASAMATLHSVYGKPRLVV